MEEQKKTLLEKLQGYYAAAKPYFAKAYAFSPFALGATTGYFGHGLIKAGVDTALFVVKNLFKI